MARWIFVGLLALFFVGMFLSSNGGKKKFRHKRRP
jgi:uncharacterized protein YneF (UPF0154 family)